MIIFCHNHRFAILDANIAVMIAETTNSTKMTIWDMTTTCYEDARHIHLILSQRAVPIKNVFWVVVFGSTSTSLPVNLLALEDLITPGVLTIIVSNYSY